MAAVAAQIDDEKGIVGLQNMGNTCYANSTLQILRAVPEWSVFCMTSDFGQVDDNTTPTVKMLQAYQDILKSLWSASRPAYVRPLGFLSIVQSVVKGTVYQSFGRPEPNDSHEYLIYLLDNFHEALKKPTVSGDSDNEEGWQLWKKKNDTPVVELFFGMTRKTVECSNCGNKNHTYEPFNVFKIPCSGTSFEDWIASELATNELEDYDCIKCRPTRQKAKIHLKLWRLPHALFVALRRFQFDGRKDMRPCPYNGEKITLKRFFAEESTDPSRDYTYEIRGVVDHHGNHMGGHYTAQFCHPQTKKFWWIDDERSQKMDGGPLFGQSTYLLLFRKVD
jgi:ubiquitin C-terminal hydrolase